MSDLTITHAGVAQTAKSGTDEKKGKIIRVTPTLDAGTAYAQHDVLLIQLKYQMQLESKEAVQD